MKPKDFISQLEKSTQHKTLYHFTDKRNLPSIRRHGILSAKRAEELGVEISVRGGNDWSQEADAWNGMDGYVHLCLTNSHPMEFRAKEAGRLVEVLYLPIKTEVILLDGILISDDVANKRGVQRLAVAEVLPKMDHEVLYARTDWKDPEIQARLKAAEKFEVLVPDEVPLEYIIFPSNS